MPTAALERFKAIGRLPPQAIQHIVNVLYILTQAAFCTKVSVFECVCMCVCVCV